MESILFKAEFALVEGICFTPAENLVCVKESGEGKQFTPPLAFRNVILPAVLVHMVCRETQIVHILNYCD